MEQIIFVPQKQFSCFATLLKSPMTVFFSTRLKRFHLGSLVLSDDDHHADAGQEGDDLHDRLLPLDADQQLWNDGDCGDVDEAAGGEGQDVGGCSGLSNPGRDE